MASTAPTTSIDRTGPSPAERREVAKERLLNATEELLASGGLAAATMAAIGERAGYSRGLANHHFGEKAKVFEELTDRARRTFLESLAALEGVTGMARLQTLVEGYIEAFSVAPPYIRAFFVMRSTAYPENSGSTDIGEYDRDSRAIVTSWVREGQSDGSIRLDVSAESAAWLVISLGRGLGEQLLVSRDEFDTEELKKDARRFVTAALAPPPPDGT